MGTTPLQYYTARPIWPHFRRKADLISLINQSRNKRHRKDRTTNEARRSGVFIGWSVGTSLCPQRDHIMKPAGVERRLSSGQPFIRIQVASTPIVCRRVQPQNNAAHFLDCSVKFSVPVAARTRAGSRNDFGGFIFRNELIMAPNGVDFTRVVEGVASGSQSAPRAGP